MAFIPLVANSLGHLVRVVAVFVLEFVHELDVFLFGLFGGDAFIDDLLPGLLLGFTLDKCQLCSSYSAVVEAAENGGITGWTATEVVKGQRIGYDMSVVAFTPGCLPSGQMCLVEVPGQWEDLVELA